MNPETRNDSSPSRATAFLLNFSKKALAWVLVYLMIPLGLGDLYAYAQMAPPPPPDQQQYDQEDQGPPPENYDVLSPDQLNKLVAPIALYPDSLVAQILAASTYPTEVADADHFLQSNQGLPPDQLGDMVNSMDWDPSVKALIAFPSVLENLDRNLDWTSQLGNAYYNQPQDVMDAIQDMRQRAYEAGNLRSTQQLAVDYNPGDIVIAPANPDVVYVPWYDPWTVYGSPMSPWSGYYVRPRPAGFFFAGGLGLGFGIGIAVGHYNRWGWGWHNWGMGWRNRSIVYNRNVYISRSPHVRNHGYYGRFDRNPAARSVNRRIAQRFRSSHPAYRPNSNVRRAPGFNRNQPNRPNDNVRRAPGFNRNQPANRPNSNVRPNQPNFRNQPNRPNTNRPNYTRPNTANRPNSNVRQAPNFNRPNTNRPNTNRPSPNRPDSNIRRNPTFNRPQPQARPQARPEARPEARPQFRPQQRQEARPQARPEQQQRQARPEQQRQARPQQQRQARPQQQRQARPERQARPSDNRGQSDRGHEKKEGH